MGAGDSFIAGFLYEILMGSGIEACLDRGCLLYTSEIMMKVLCKKCKSLGVQAPVYVSMENRMACGIGACLVCTCKTSAGNKRACKDGPVMLGSEVFGNE